jgi:hypothetical protein
VKQPQTTCFLSVGRKSISLPPRTSLISSREYLRPSTNTGASSQTMEAVLPLCFLPPATKPRLLPHAGHFRSPPWICSLTI